MNHPGLVDVIHWLEDVLDRLQLRRSYGGAIAYNYYGPPRLTVDVDVLVLIPDLKAPGLVEALLARGCLHGDKDPRPIELRAVLDDLRGKAHLAAFRCGDIRTEIFVPWHPLPSPGAREKPRARARGAAHTDPRSPRLRPAGLEASAFPAFAHWQDPDTRES